MEVFWKEDKKGTKQIQEKFLGSYIKGKGFNTSQQRSKEMQKKEAVAVNEHTHELKAKLLTMKTLK